jgi:uncharacterized protein YndB with AHSA1/START domain
MTTVTEAATTQVYEVFIKAPPERIWDAITRPEFTVKYFHGAAIAVVDDKYASHGPDGSTSADEPVYEYSPPRRLVHGWRSLYDPDMAQESRSRVTWRSSPVTAGCAS